MCEVWGLGFRLKYGCGYEGVAHAEAGGVTADEVSNHVGGEGLLEVGWRIEGEYG
jgi:hypothetical protein